jgi:hypothetical protein
MPPRRNHADRGARQNVTVLGDEQAKLTVGRGSCPAAGLLLRHAFLAHPSEIHVIVLQG